MQRQRGRPEMNPPSSADPPSATPVRPANLAGSVAAAFNGRYPPHLVASVPCRCPMPFLRVVMSHPFFRLHVRYPAPASICTALAYFVHAKVPPSTLFRVRWSMLCVSAGPPASTTACLPHLPLSIRAQASPMSSTHVSILRSRRLYAGHVHRLQHQEASE